MTDSDLAEVKKIAEDKATMGCLAFWFALGAAIIFTYRINQDHARIVALEKQVKASQEVKSKP